MTRATWDEYFMGVAEAVAARADCTRRKVGAVIVGADHRIVSTGYNGAPSGAGSCLAGECPRGRHYESVPSWAGRTMCESDLCDCCDYDARECACGNEWPCPDAVGPGSSYDSGPGTCIALHAEQNAIIYGSVGRMAGGSIYITSESCAGCLRLIHGVGISHIYWPGKD